MDGSSANTKPEEKKSMGISLLTSPHGNCPFPIHSATIFSYPYDFLTV